ncbi:shikimate dehydrogenase [Candidatus Peregrinibacteria bacterium]|jgi:shikimate dehydrogenase|nr:shikimate dehydrogenase [Candidatus Peregrinibacteria bacterium]
MTKIFGIIAHPVEHSLSPAMHNAAFKALNIDAVFEKFDVLPEELAAFMSERTDIEGLAISLPHKEEVGQYLDEITDEAAQIGAVNTMYKKNGRIVGANTDAPGFLKALQEVTSIVDKRVVVMGAGGAARAVIAALKPHVNSITIINRTPTHGVDLAKEFGVRYGGNFADLTTETPDIIVNATSIGLEGKDEPNLVPQDFFEPDMTIFDIVYRAQGQTKLLADAEAAGCTTVDGKKMLLYQGMIQFELWTGQEAPQKIMKEAL